MIIDGIKYKKTHLEVKRLARVRRWDRKLTFRAKNPSRFHFVGYEKRASKYKPHQGEREKARRLRNIDKAIATAIF